MPTVSSKDIPKTQTLIHSAATKSSTQRVYGELRKLIIEGSISPGEKLKVESLKLQLRAGATPIREALSLLTSDQLVERIDQRGFRAASASLEHFQEILDLRCQLENIALRKSIAAANPLWEENLVLALHRLAQSNENRDANRESLHKEFHLALIDGCGSPILIKFCDQLYDLNIRYRYLAGRSVGYRKRDISSEHQSILTATVAKDSDCATELLVEHYKRTGEFLQDQLGESLALL